MRVQAVDGLGLELALQAADRLAAARARVVAGAVHGPCAPVDAWQAVVFETHADHRAELVVVGPALDQRLMRPWRRLVRSSCRGPQGPRHDVVPSVGRALPQHARGQHDSLPGVSLAGLPLDADVLVAAEKLDHGADGVDARGTELDQVADLKTELSERHSDTVARGRRTRYWTLVPVLGRAT